MKTSAQTLLFAVLALPLMASAGNKAASATMQVGLVIREVCAIQATPAAGNSAATARPTVACQANSPYQLTRNSDKPAAPAASNSSTSDMAIRPQAGAQDWTVYF